MHTSDKQIEHSAFKATVTTTTEQGEFTAVISSASVDREGDSVEPQAVVNALAKWVPLGKKVPLSWNHSVEAEDIIGHIEPGSAKAENNEVIVGGWVDQTTERGTQAWRLVKSGTLGFSYGYLPLKSASRGSRGRKITELDIFEITATPAPMNGDTRVLGWKSVTDEEMSVQDPAHVEPDLVNELQALKGRMDAFQSELEDLRSKKAEVTDKDPGRSVDPLRKRSEELALEIASGGMSLRKPPTKATEQQTQQVDPDELRRQSRDFMFEVLSYTTEI